MNNIIYDSHFHCESEAVNILKNIFETVGITGGLALPWEEDDETFLNRRDQLNYTNVDVALVPRLKLYGTNAWQTEMLRIESNAKYYAAVKIYKQYINEAKYSIEDYTDFWDLLSEIRKPIIIHFGDPIEFWTSDGGLRKLQYSRHSEFRYYNNSCIESRSDIMSKKGLLLKKYNNIMFVCAHLGGFPSNIAELEAYLSSSYTDTSAALDEVLTYDYSHVKKLICANHDKILYGSDAMIFSPQSGKDSIYIKICSNNMIWNLKQLKENAIVNTSNPGELIWKVRGLGLEEKYLEYILYKNYFKIFGK